MTRQTLALSALAFLLGCGGGNNNELCGNNVLDAGETCDDGNATAGDGCDAECQNEGEPACGDGILQAGEECDDGNLLPGDACNADCTNPPVEDTFTANDIGNFFFDFARYCVGMETRHAVVHEKDAEDGNLRWRCGDITDIENTGAGFGQEYCEYSAVRNGQEIESAANVPDGESFSCLFTAVYQDNQGGDDASNLARDNELIAALADPQNLGATVNQGLVRMERGVNSRGAADGLINSCLFTNEDTNELRQAACAQAFVEAENAGDDALAGEILAACQGVNLANDANFAAAQALGAEVVAEDDPGFDTQRNIMGCTATQRGGGVFFRNSDTQICARFIRAGAECNCSFELIPDAVEGFSFAVWFTPENDSFPPECRPAVVNGQAYDHLMICDVPTAEVAQIKASAKYGDNLTQFCNDRFGKNIGMLAPVPAITVPGSCDDNNNFCGTFQD